MKESQEKRAAIYVRVSTTDQSTAAQESELREYVARRGWSVFKVYSDHGVSGAKSSRPALNDLMADCRKRRVDVVLVWKFDRFARSLRQLVSALEEFNNLGIDFVSCTESIDTSIPSGELIFHIFGAFAQFERALISERVVAGMLQARRAGKQIGRLPLRELNSDEINSIRELGSSNNASVRGLARKFKTTEWMIGRILASRNGANKDRLLGGQER